MSTAIARIVVQISCREKLAIAVKAKRLKMPISELMRRGALAYETAMSRAQLNRLAGAIQGASERAGASIDDALKFIAQSNKRIAAMDAAAPGITAAALVKRIRDR